MPKWLSSLLIVVGFLALVGLAFLPRTIEVNVVTNVDDSDIHHGDYLNHAPPPAAD